MKTHRHLARSLWFFLAAFSCSGVLLGIQEVFHVDGFAQLPMYGPTLAALLFLWRDGASLAGFFRRSFAFTLNGPVLAGLAIPIVVTACIAYWTQPYWGLASVLDPSSNTSLTVFYVVAMFFAVIGEEIGWRGYLLPMLQERFTPLVSSLEVGVIWGVWHTLCLGGDPVR
jgi:membrane protease YdiL (CAAX protease family)